VPKLWKGTGSQVHVVKVTETALLLGLAASLQTENFKYLLCQDAMGDAAN